LTWDGTLEPSDILTDAQQGEFRWWCEFQLRYKYAHETLRMKDGDAHQYACDGRNPYRLPASSTLCFAKRCMAVLPPGLALALGPVLE
jgi:hypothetical protein